MIVIMKQGATEAQISSVTGRIEQLGWRVHLSQGEERTIVGVIGNGRLLDREQIERMDGVERTVPILRPFKLASRDFHPQDTVVKVNGVSIGGRRVVVMAGPCAVESGSQLLETARVVQQMGARVLRGGAFKPRTSPYSFQGLGEEGLRLLARARYFTIGSFVLGNVFQERRGELLGVTRGCYDTRNDLPPVSRQEHHEIDYELCR